VSHSESLANLLIHIGSNFTGYSECALISLKVLPDFDSTMRRFESSRPSQAFVRFPWLPKRREDRPEIRAFRVLVSVSVLLVQRSQGEIAESLRPCTGIFPFCGDCRQRPV
jgi:hypothetical protein